MKGAEAAYRAAAEAGNPLAQRKLGVIEYDRENYDEAVGWFRKAVDQGYGNAWVNLATAFFEGKGVKRDPAEAIRLHELAARKGNVTSQKLLGDHFQKGLAGVGKDVDRALYWYLISAKRVRDANFELGRILEDQIKDGLDPRVARHWYYQAKRRRHPEAAAAVARIDRHVSKTASASDTKVTGWSDAAQLGGSRWDMAIKISRINRSVVTFHKDHSFDTDNKLINARKKQQWRSPDKKSIRFHFSNGFAEYEGKFVDVDNMRGTLTMKNGTKGTWSARRLSAGGVPTQVPAVRNRRPGVRRRDPSLPAPSGG